MSTVDPLSYTIVADDGRADSQTTQELRQGLEKGSDEVKLETLRRIIVSTVNGSPHVRPLVSNDPRPPGDQIESSSPSCLPWACTGGGRGRHARAPALPSRIRPAVVPCSG